MLWIHPARGGGGQEDLEELKEQSRRSRSRSRRDRRGRRRSSSSGSRRSSGGISRRSQGSREQGNRRLTQHGRSTESWYCVLQILVALLLSFVHHFVTVTGNDYKPHSVFYILCCATALLIIWVPASEVSPRRRPPAAAPARPTAALPPPPLRVDTSVLLSERHLLKPCAMTKHFRAFGTVHRS